MKDVGRQNYLRFEHYQGGISMRFIRWSKVFILAILSLGLLGSLAVSAEKVKNPDTLIELSATNFESLDPHFMVSSSSMEITFNVYNSLIFYDKEEEEYKPSLATKVPSIDNGLIQVKEDGSTVITFPIREGVKFHNGDTLAPEDVEYTFQRAILAGGDSDTLRPLRNALIGGKFQDLAEEKGYEQAFDKLEESIQVDGMNVVFTLDEPYAPFVPLMADGGMSLGIMSKDWCIEQGCWPGTKETGEDHMSLQTEKDPILDKMNGTGPFKLLEWSQNDRIVLEKFEDYWKEPAKIDKVIRRYVPDTSTQLLQLKQGDADVGRFMPAEIQQLKGSSGLRFEEKLPSFWLMKLNYNFDIQTRKNIGSGKLDGKGIPPDFFTDINVRKAFSYSFDSDLFLRDVYLGKALKPYGVVPRGMPHANPDNPQYSFNADKAEEYFKKAWDGKVWEEGFKFTAIYSEGSTHRQRFLEILKRNVEALNPKFNVSIQAAPWATMLGMINNGSMPVSLFGLIPAVPDPYLPVADQMYSKGYYAGINGYQELAEEKYDEHIKKLRESFDPEVRKEAAYELQRLCYEDALALIYWQAAENWAMRDWVKGFKTSIVTMNLDYSTIYKE